MKLLKVVGGILSWLDSTVESITNICVAKPR